MAETSNAARYLSAPQVAQYLSISRSMVDVLVRRGRIPAPVELTPRLKRWDRDAIDATLGAPPLGAKPGPNVDEIVARIAEELKRAPSRHRRTRRAPDE